MEEEDQTREICTSAAELAPLLYPDMKRAARSIRSQMPPSGTLQTTALIHEAYMKMLRGGPWQSRKHFLASAAVAMRHVLIDEARARSRLRRGEGVAPVSLDEMMHGLESQALWTEMDGDVGVAVGEAIEELSRIEPRLARVVECRFFAGYTEAETGEILGIAGRTVRRDWIKARSWLQARLADYSDVVGSEAAG